MKVLRPAFIASLLLLLSIAEAAAFGPHGDGRIGNSPEQFRIFRGFPVYQNFNAPVSYPSQTRRDVLRLGRRDQIIEVEGKSSKLDFFIPIGFLFGFSPTSGISVDIKDRGVQMAIADAKERYGVDVLYDIRIDVNIFSILGVYNKTTTMIHAKGFRSLSGSRSD